MLGIVCIRLLNGWIFVFSHKVHWVVFWQPVSLLSDHLVPISLLCRLCRVYDILYSRASLVLLLRCAFNGVSPECPDCSMRAFHSLWLEFESLSTLLSSGISLASSFPVAVLSLVIVVILVSWSISLHIHSSMFSQTQRIPMQISTALYLHSFFLFHSLSHKIRQSQPSQTLSSQLIETRYFPWILVNLFKV